MSGHDFMGCDESCNQCIRCGGHWSDERVDDANYCVATETDYSTVHGSDIDNTGHPLECEEYAETETCQHVEHGCNCDICEFG